MRFSSVSVEVCSARLSASWSQTAAMAKITRCSSRDIVLASARHSSARRRYSDVFFISLPRTRSVRARGLVLARPKGRCLRGHAKYLFWFATINFEPATRSFERWCSTIELRRRQAFLFRFAVNRQFGMPFDERGSILGQARPGGGHFEQLVPLLWPVMSFASAWHSSA